MPGREGRRLNTNALVDDSTQLSHMLLVTSSKLPSETLHLGSMPRFKGHQTSINAVAR